MVPWAARPAGGSAASSAAAGLSAPLEPSALSAPPVASSAAPSWGLPAGSLRRLGRLGCLGRLGGLGFVRLPRRLPARRLRGGRDVGFLGCLGRLGCLGGLHGRWTLLRRRFLHRGLRRGEDRHLGQQHRQRNRHRHRSRALRAAGRARAPGWLGQRRGRRIGHRGLRRCRRSGRRCRRSGRGGNLRDARGLRGRRCDSRCLRFLRGHRHIRGGACCTTGAGCWIVCGGGGAGAAGVSPKLGSSRAAGRTSIANEITRATMPMTTITAIELPTSSGVRRFRGTGTRCVAASWSPWSGSA